MMTLEQMIQQHHLQQQGMNLQGMAGGAGCGAGVLPDSLSQQANLQQQMQQQGNIIRQAQATQQGLQQQMMGLQQQTQVTGAGVQGGMQGGMQGGAQGVMQLQQIADLPRQCRGGQNSAHPQQLLQQQQLEQKKHLLVLLLHASKCSAGNPQNPEMCVWQHCAPMKQLWQHIKTCKNQHCATSDCFMARGVLTHYDKCPDQSSCMVCGTVSKISGHLAASIQYSAGMVYRPVRQAIQRRQVVQSGGQGGNGGKGGKGDSSESLRARWASKKSQQAKPAKKRAALLPPPVGNTNGGQSRKRVRVVASGSNSGSDDDTLSDSSGPPPTKIKVEMIGGFSIMSAASDLKHTACGLARQGAPTS
jgi:hypothetical protein